DVPDRPALERLDGAALAHLRVMQWSESRPHRVRTAGNHLVTAPQLGHATVEVAPLVALQQRRLGRIVAGGDVALVDPSKVEAVQVAVADLQQHALAGVGIAGDGFAFLDLAQNLAAILERQLHNRLLPEKAQAIDGDEQQQAKREQQVEGERAAAQPGERLAEAIGAPAAGYRSHGVNCPASRRERHANYNLA